MPSWSMLFIRQSSSTVLLYHTNSVSSTPFCAGVQTQSTLSHYNSRFELVSLGEFRRPILLRHCLTRYVKQFDCIIVFLFLVLPHGNAIANRQVVTRDCAHCPCSALPSLAPMYTAPHTHVLTRVKSTVVSCIFIVKPGY